MRPNDEPAFGVEEIYYQMYLLAIGLQMAGPEPHAGDLRGRHVRLPGRQRAARARGASAPGDYTPTDDFREIWWDPNRISPQNNKPGAWVQLERRRRGTRRGNAADGPGPLLRGGMTWPTPSSNGAVARRRRSRVARALRTTRERAPASAASARSSVGIVLFVLMVLLAPTVAPEQVVERAGRRHDHDHAEAAP